MATAVWKGLLRFGLLSMSVKLYRAAQAEKISFRQLHKSTGARVRHELCAEAGPTMAVPTSKDTPSEGVLEKAKGNTASTRPAEARRSLRSAALKHDDLVKGYEFEKGRYVRLSREELAQMVPATAREINVGEFIQPAEIDILLVDSTFFVAPNWGSERAYGVFTRALDRSGVVGVSQITMHSRESVILVRAYDRGIIAQTLFYEPEIRRELQYRGQRFAVREQELRLALRLIQQGTARFDPLKYYDRYRDGVQQLVRESVAGGELATATGDDSTRLVQALKASLQTTARETLPAENTR